MANDLHESRERAERFLTYLVEAHREYHHHKEGMAYAGFALGAAAFGWGLVSSEWPPHWFDPCPLARAATAVLAISGAWFFILRFLVWQLRLRRWAALRVAGTERLLATWITNPPTPEDLAPFGGNGAPPAARTRASDALVLACDYVWPIGQTTVRADVAEAAYPRAVVVEWHQQEGRGTGAIIHERLLLSAGWLLCLTLVIRTIAAVC